MVTHTAARAMRPRGGFRAARDAPVHARGEAIERAELQPAAAKPGHRHAEQELTRARAHKSGRTKRRGQQVAGRLLTRDLVCFPLAVATAALALAFPPPPLLCARSRTDRPLALQRHEQAGGGQAGQLGPAPRQPLRAFKGQRRASPGREPGSSSLTAAPIDQQSHAPRSIGVGVATAARGGHRRMAA